VYETLNVNLLRDLADDSLINFTAEETTYDSFGYWKQDSAFAASVIYTTYFAQQDLTDPTQHRRTFWEWWLTQAIPAAWRQARSHK